jgi:hypothetical protein
MKVKEEENGKSGEKKHRGNVHKKRDVLLTKFCAASNSSILFCGGTLTVGAVTTWLSPPPVAAPLLANEGNP